MTRARRIVLLGPPGAGCTSVGRELAQTVGGGFEELGRIVAERLGVQPQTALVEVPEPRYRQVEAACAVRLVREMGRDEECVLGLGSGCLEQAEVLEALAQLRRGGGTVVALVAETRCLATRNGLDAPRSVGLGGVYRQFTRMLREREAVCRELADVVVDTTTTGPREAADLVHEALAGRCPTPRDRLDRRSTWESGSRAR